MFDLNSAARGIHGRLWRQRVFATIMNLLISASRGALSGHVQHNTDKHSPEHGVTQIYCAQVSQCEISDISGRSQRRSQLKRNENARLAFRALFHGDRRGHLSVRLCIC